MLLTPTSYLIVWLLSVIVVIMYHCPNQSILIAAIFTPRMLQTGILSLFTWCWYSQFIYFHPYQHFYKIDLYKISRHKFFTNLRRKSSIFPTNLHRIDPSTFHLFILDNKAIWIQTTAQSFPRFSVPIYRKILDFTTFSAPTTFITLCTPLSKMQKIMIFSPRLTRSFRVKISVRQWEPTAFRVKMMLSL